VRLRSRLRGTRCFGRDYVPAREQHQNRRRRAIRRRDERAHRPLIGGHGLGRHASATSLESSSAVFEAKATGNVAILARAPEGGTTVLDYIDLDLRAPDALSIEFVGTFGVGNDVEATLSQASVPLDGDYGCTWSVSDATASITHTPVSYAQWFWYGSRNLATLVVAKSGTITITATCLGFTRSMTATVFADGGIDDASAADASDAGITDADAGDASDASVDVTDAGDAND
jgi:hypothetical protein